MSYEILKRLGLDHLDTSSPDFLRVLQRLQRDAWLSLQAENPLEPPHATPGEHVAD